MTFRRGSADFNFKGPKKNGGSARDAIDQNASSPVGLSGTTRRDQIRLTYTDGPLSWAVAMEEPTYSSYTTMPDITTSIVYDVAGGHQFQIIAGVADWYKNGEAVDAGGVDHADELGWCIGGGLVLNLADVATLSADAVYGEGLVVASQLNCYSNLGVSSANALDNGFTGQTVDANGNPIEAWGMHAGLGFSVNETTTANITFGYEEVLESAPTESAATDFKKAWTVGGNIIWQPVKQMKMGWEINYGGEAKSFDKTIQTEALQAVWGTCFYF